MSRPRLTALLLALFTLAVFLPAAQFRFVNFDDNDYITSNPIVKSGLTWSGAQWAFTAFHAGNWHPVTWLSHMADCQFFQLHAGAHHIVNVLFHAANTALLFILLRRLTNRLWPAALIAALFAWHPLHAESVAWVSERKDVLCAFFWLLSLLAYAKYVENMVPGAADGSPPSPQPSPPGRGGTGSRVGGNTSNRIATQVPVAAGEARITHHVSRFTFHASRFYWLSLGFFTLALMSKPMAVTLPFVLLLLDFWPLNRVRSAECGMRNFKPLVLEKIPFFLLAAASCVVTLLAQHSGHAIVSLDQTPLSYRLENAPVAVAAYLQKFFWPADLCALYLMPARIPALHVCLALALLVLISAAAWHWRNSKPYFLMGWLWFLGTLVPVIGLVQVGNQALADRYTYLPSIGFFIALVFGGDEFAARMQTPKSIRFGLAGLIALACILATEKQLPYWRNGESVFRRAVAVNPNNDVALVDLGVALDVQKRFDEAIDVYNQAERAGSRRFEVHNNLGNVLGILGRHAESLAEYRQAIQIAPDNAAAHAAAARQLAALNQFDDALKEFSQAEALNPNDAAVDVDAASVLFKIGRDADGLVALHTALQIEPDNFQTMAAISHYLAANENAAARDGKIALSLALKANQLSGRSQPTVFDVLGMALAETGDFSNAVTCAQNALTLARKAQLQNTAPLQTRLELYQNGRRWHESFRGTNAP